METYGDVCLCQRKPWASQRAKKCETGRKNHPNQSRNENLIRRICSWHFPAATPPKRNAGLKGITNHQSSPGEGGIRGAPLDFLDFIRSPKKAKHTWVNLQLPTQTRLPIPVDWVSLCELGISQWRIPQVKQSIFPNKPTHFAVRSG